MIPWFDAMNWLSPVTSMVAMTLGFCNSTSSTRSCSSCICSGEEPSRPMNTPVTTLLSPGGKNAFGTTIKNQTVPARQTTQTSAEIQRCTRNQDKYLP